MKLKKLELSGFKSFVDKISIGFPPGISAIVGPNGCGKSNVVDALRWVMGEQSVKQLRGKSMEDIIFSGADGRPPLNMAEVSLTLLNDNGTIPEEFRDLTEIQVTRRLFRSGESAYLINRQPCRLKDVHNLFMGSGMGAKTYAVIQQGSIGAITDAGPEERRLFIEEAAGITRYKTRKNEALRKVKSTQQNLLRVSDIITEVKRQMNGLKRQARKAERFRKLQDQVRSCDVVLSLKRDDQYGKQLDETSRLLHSLKDTDIQHASKLKQLDAAIEEIKLKRWQKDQEISEHKSRRFECQRRMDRLESDIAHLRQDKERLLSEIDELRSVQQDIEENNQSIVQEIQEVDAENNRLRDEKKNALSAFEQDRQNLDQAKEQLTRIQEELEECKTDLMTEVTEEARYRNILQTAAGNKESLNRRLKRIDEEERLSVRQVETSREQKTAADKHLRTVQSRIETVNQEIRDAGEKLDSLSSALAGQVKAVQTLELERKECRSRHTTLKRMEENYEWYREGVRAIMKGAKGETEGVSSETILGLMAEVIDPEPSYEIAAEAVLGEALQYVLVRDQGAGAAAIDFLQTRRAGRSGFIPMGSVRKLEKQDQPDLDADRRLLNHVTITPGYEAIAQALLGHVVVSDTLEEAFRIWNANGRLQTVVTKGGDLITHQGVIQGGSPEKLSGILTKKQEIKDLEERIEALGMSLIEAEEKQESLEDDVREAQHRLHELTEEKQLTVQQEIEAQKALVQAAEEFKQADRRLEIVRLEQEQLLGEESDLDDQLAKYDQVLKDIEKRVKSAQNSVSACSERLQTASEETEACNQKVVDHRLKMTTIEASLENSDHTLRRLRQFQDDGIRRQEQVVRDVALKQQKTESAEQTIADHKKTLSELYSDLGGLEKTIEVNEQDYQAIDTQLQENDGIITDIRSQREELLQKIRLLEVEQSQRQVKKEGIAQRLLERYGRTLAALCTEFDQMKDLPSGEIPELEENLETLQKKLNTIGDVNLGAIKEYEELSSRFEFLTSQRDDLTKAIEDLQKVIRKINRISRERFTKTFERINKKLAEVFPRLFDGGSARLVLTDPDDPLETGVEHMIHPPGKKLTRMSLLSGGEKAMAAIAFLFSIFLIKPASFCLMDEIDAPLDEANIFRFNNLLQIIGENSQIIMVTHNKRSMEFADTLFGITMEKKGVSKVVHVNLTGGQSPKQDREAPANAA